jgi:putative hemolysin
MSPLLIIAASILASGFFSGMEIAYVSANRIQGKLDAEQSFQGRLIAHLSQRPQLFIATMLVGNNLALVFCGLESGSLISEWLFKVPDWTVAAHPITALITQTGITTAVILVLAEFIPKALVHGDPNHWLRILALPLTLAHYVLIAPGWFVMILSKLALRIFHSNRDTSDVDVQAEKLGGTDLDHFIREMSNRLGPQKELENELQIMQNALEFKDVRARDCMIPRNEIEATELSTDIDSVRDQFVETGLSKIVVYRGDIDQIVGYVHAKDLFSRPASIAAILHPTFIIPEPMAADEVLRRFMRRRRHLAIVVDEFGGTSGILTMEDIVEEIVGEIADEHDVEELIEERLGPSEWRFSARMEIDALLERHEIELPEDDAYETLAGLILHTAAQIPSPGFGFQVDEYYIEVETVEANRVELVRIFRSSSDA